MKATEFKKLMDDFKRTNRSQRDKLRQYLDCKVQGDQGIKLIESSFSAQRCCPHCTSSKPYLWGKSNGLQRYRCCACKRTFNALAHLRHCHFQIPYFPTDLI